MKTKTSPTNNTEPTSIPIISIKMIKEDEIQYSNKQITGPYGAVDILKGFFDGMDREMFIVLCLSAYKRPTGINIVSVGSLTSNTVAPREVFKPAILCNAHSIIVAHNHPSGSMTASSADKEITERIAQVGQMIGIELNDHLIFGDTWTSLRAMNEELFV